MKSYRIVNLLIAALFTLSLLPLQVQPALAQAPKPRTADTSAQYVPGEVLVVMQPTLSNSASGARASSLAGTVGAVVVQRSDNVALLSVDAKADVPALAAKLIASGQVQIAQPNYVYKAPEVAAGMKGQPYHQPDYVAQSSGGQSTHLSWDQLNNLRSIKKVGYRSAAVPTFPNELGAGRLWAWDKIQADLIWSEKKAAPLVCVLDTGVDATHPDLAGKVVAGKDFVNNDSLPADDNGHGTHVAGLIVAKLNNGATTAAGVSSGSILSVKVLDAQGLGTSYSVTAGIIYCGKNASVKIINMSLGSYAADAIQYVALKTALATRLLVAAAGNDSTSQPFYPAAYAEISVAPPVPNTAGDITNKISKQVIAVGASHSPAYPYKLWVDTNGNNIIDGGEMFNPEDCATGQTLDNGFVYGSNYGRWVTLVAPGEDIYSTTPYATPFYGHYAEGLANQYDYMSGTSMAAALVAGAAARMWSILPAISTPPIYQAVKIKLEARGEALNFASDGTAALDHTQGYASQITRVDYDGNTVEFGKPFRPTSGQFDPNVKIVAAPFCWPGGNATTQWGDTERMDSTGSKTSPTVYLNVAKAMQRSALMAEVKDAASGGPLAGASVAAYDTSPVPAVLRDTSVTTAGSGTVMMINLPVVFDGLGIPHSLWYDLKVSKAGYTSGYQTFDHIQAPTDDYTGKIYKDNYSSVGLLPLANINFVLDWIDPKVNAGIPPYPDVDLDLMLRLPQNADGAGTLSTPHEGFIGSGFTWGTQPKIVYYSGLGSEFLGKGTLLDTLTNGGYWSPFAVHNYDGGIAQGFDDFGRPINPTESISVKPGPATPAVIGITKLTFKPYYNKPKPSGNDLSNNNYRLFVTDYSRESGLNQTSHSGKHSLLRDSTDPNFVAPIVRVWSGGKLIKSVELETSKVSTCDGDISGDDLWQVLDVKPDGTLTTQDDTIPNPANTCDTVSSPNWWYGQ